MDCAAARGIDALLGGPSHAKPLPQLLRTRLNSNMGNSALCAGPHSFPSRCSSSSMESDAASQRLRVRSNLLVDNRAQVEAACPTDTVTTDILGLGQAMVDLCATAKDSTLQDLGLQKGSRNQCTQSERSLILESLEQDGSYTLSSGGSLSNSLVAVSRLGNRSLTVGMAGNIGSDALGGFYARELANSQVRWLTETRQHTTTGTVIVITTPDAQRTMISHRGSCDGDLVLGNRAIDAITSTRVLVVEGYLLEISGGYDAILKALALAKSTGALVALTAADKSCVSRHCPEFWNLIREGGVDILFSNDKEACELTGCDNLNKSVDELGRHIPLVSVTCGAKGSNIVLNGIKEKIEPYRRAIPAVDTCGAGDAYAAGMLYGLFNGASAHQMGNIAAQVAAYVIKKTGAALTEGDAEAFARMMAAHHPVGDSSSSSSSSSAARVLSLPYPRCSRWRLAEVGGGAR